MGREGKYKPKPRQMLRGEPDMGRRIHWQRRAQKIHFAFFPIFPWGSLSYDL